MNYLTKLSAVGAASAAAAIAMAAPGLAQASTGVDIYASGSSLQASLQGNGTSSGWVYNWEQAGANGLTGISDPAITYAGTNSGAGEAEFGVASGGGNVTPSDSANGTYLDGFEGEDEAPNTTEIDNAETDTGSYPEVVPVVQAPVAIVMHLPSGCSVSSTYPDTPIFTNYDLSEALGNTSTYNISWENLLTDALIAGDSSLTTTTAQAYLSSACLTSSVPTVQVRSDVSGTSYATKKYESLVASGTFTSSYVNENDSWPGTTSSSWNNGGTVTQDSGSGGEANAVAGVAGSIGYVNTANAVSAGFTASGYTTSGGTFYADVQNNGIASGTSSVLGDEPITGTSANCGSAYYGGVTLPTGDPSDWSSVFVQNPSIDNTGNSLHNQANYSLCTLTYDVAWEKYDASSGTGNNNLDNDYSVTTSLGTETPATVGVTAADYLKWLVALTQGGVSAGQASSNIPHYYAALPVSPNTSDIQSHAAAIASKIDSQS